MRSFFIFGLILSLSRVAAQDTLTIAFGSCNKPKLNQTYWDNIASHNPQYFFWLGDNIYGDSEDMAKLRADYNQQLSDSNYARFKQKVKIDGTWDDHDYGVNDGGNNFPKKKEAKSEMVRFIGFDKEHKIHQHEGVYHSETILSNGLKTKTLFLDTRYFRSDLKRDPNNKRRYTTSDTGTMLGKEQWKWLQQELADTTVDLFLIASSIQVIANDHWFEKWGNLPHERQRFMDMCKDKAVIVLSGDRHIAEVSSIKNGKHALIDITSSGLTHTWRSYRYEANQHRVGKQFALTNFGILQVVKQDYGFDVHLEFRESYSNKLLQLLVLQYAN
jgi:alkaline phosphatase D